MRRTCCLQNLLGRVVAPEISLFNGSNIVDIHCSAVEQLTGKPYITICDVTFTGNGDLEYEEEI